ncbi:hypothetical protein A1359_12300 [Methylomonas lenta]|uniref:Uncharacterized protein n=2 Tax=Methylomonas lenta TaxID=980561 RepID=A0A177N8E6_9GAMM|nr:hypothetical protein A1359_12300 [Methylomonas lenta]
MVIAGTEGYTESADSLIARYERVSFAEKYESVFHLMPEKTSDVLDIGAGTEADAAWFAAAGLGCSPLSQRIAFEILRKRFTHRR